MPKKGKRKADDCSIYEGRPAGLTFGAFLVPAASQGTRSDDQIQDNEKRDIGNEQIKEPFYVTRTKKGKLPITYENRSKGKKVTVISNVYGDAEGLVTELRKRLGVGGVARGTVVELQGDQQKCVEEFFKNHPNCVK